VSQKKKKPLLFYDNSGKYGPILKILPPLYFDMTLLTGDAKFTAFP